MERLRSRTFGWMVCLLLPALVSCGGGGGSSTGIVAAGGTASINLNFALPGAVASTEGDKLLPEGSRMLALNKLLSRLIPDAFAAITPVGIASVRIAISNRASGANVKTDVFDAIAGQQISKTYDIPVGDVYALGVQAFSGALGTGTRVYQATAVIDLASSTAGVGVTIPVQMVPVINVPPLPTAPAVSTTGGTVATSQIAPNDPNNGDTHSYAITTPPANGTAIVSATGLVTYTPNTGFGGTDSITVTVTDQGGLTGTVTIPLTVSASPLAVDSTAPTISSHNPASNATSVAVDAAIDVTFSEPVTGVTASSFTLTPSGGSAMTGTSVNHNAGNNESLTHANLAYSTVYTVALTNAITDLAGNALAPTSWTFTTKPPPVWAQQAYIKAANAGTSDWFGRSVSINADTLAVGASGEDSNQTTITNGTTAAADNTAASAGAVYVYKRTGTSWAQQAYIKAANAGAGDSFGQSVSISADTLAVGAHREDSNQTTITNGTTASADNSAASAGAVYVYKRNTTNNTWAQEAYIKAANAESGDFFGAPVSISADTLAVGAYGEDSNQTIITNGTTASADNSASWAGAVYVYARTGTSWAQQAYIKAANANANDEFGRTVSISTDTLAVGAYRESSNQTTITNGATASADNSASWAGAVYVYARTGTIWAQQAYIKAANAGVDDSFGWSVSISADTLAVGASGEDSNQTTITNGTTAAADNAASGAGAVYVYARTGTNWTQQAYIKAANAGAGDSFGWSVSISADTLAVGASGEDSNQTTITNGTTASADNSAFSAGAVYVYKRTGTSWTQQAYIKAANANANDEFGFSVTISADTLAVGVIYEDSNQTFITNGSGASADNSAADAGAVYVYRFK